MTIIRGALIAIRFILCCSTTAWMMIGLNFVYSVFGPYSHGHTRGLNSFVAPRTRTRGQPGAVGNLALKGHFRLELKFYDDR